MIFVGEYWQDHGNERILSANTGRHQETRNISRRMQNKGKVMRMERVSQGRWRKKIQLQITSVCRILKKKGGMTLVEMIVTSMILMIFSVGTCRVMADSLQIFYKIRGLNNAQQVMNVLMDKITGEIEGAKVEMDDGSHSAGAPTLVISEGGKKIDLYNRTSSKIYITMEKRASDGSKIADGAEEDQTKGRLVIHYYPVQSKSESGTGSVEKYKEVDWMFDEAAYMGFEIKNLQFSLAGTDYPKNVIKVEMEIDGGRYGTLRGTRYVECYNFDTKSVTDMGKIEVRE